MTGAVEGGALQDELLAAGFSEATILGVHATARTGNCNVRAAEVTATR